MQAQFASQNPTILEIAHVLGILPETALRWIIEGRLLVAFQGAQTVMMVDKNRSLKNQNSGKVLILTKHLANRNWMAFSC